MDQNLEPLIVFSFSKRDCEFYAAQLSKMNFNTGKNNNVSLYLCIYPNSYQNY